MRNHAFVHVHGGTWRMSPAGNDVTVEGLMNNADAFRRSPAKAGEQLRIVPDAVDNWRRIAQDVGIPDTEIADMTPAFVNEQGTGRRPWRT